MNASKQTENPVCSVDLPLEFRALPAAPPRGERWISRLLGGLSAEAGEDDEVISRDLLERQLVIQAFARRSTGDAARY